MPLVSFVRVSDSRLCLVLAMQKAQFVVRLDRSLDPIEQPKQHKNGQTHTSPDLINEVEEVRFCIDRH